MARGPQRTRRKGEVRRAIAKGSVRELLDRWHLRTRRAEEAHSRATDSLGWRNFGLGGTAAILAAIVSSSVFATLQDSAIATGARIAVAAVSLLSAILIALKTYLKYGERVEAHRMASRRYGEQLREIEELQIDVSTRKNFQHEIRHLGDALDAIDMDSPNVPPRIWRWAVEAIEACDRGEIADPLEYPYGLRRLWTRPPRGRTAALELAVGRPGKGGSAMPSDPVGTARLIVPDAYGNGHARRN